MCQKNQLLLKAMKRFGIIIACLLMVTTIQAATGAIKGQVFLEEDEKLIPAAFVNISFDYKGVSTGVISDIDGRFMIKPLDAGVYTLTFSYVGYRSFVVEKIRVTPDQITHLPAIALTDLQLEMGCGVIYCTGPQMLNVDRPTEMVLKSAEIERNPNFREPALLALSANCLTEHQDRGKGFHYRGARTGSEAYYVDGIKLMGSDLNIPAQAIQNVTIHASGIPAAYGDLTGGVIIIETKSYFDLYRSHFYY